MKYSTLSSAIRAGAKLHPQGFHHYYYQGRTCALGAAEVAAGIFDSFGQSRIFDLYPVLNEPTPPCPVESCRYGGFGSFGGMVTHLNDTHRWTREKIADWIEEYENEHLGYETVSEEVTESEPPALLLQEEAALSG